MPGSSNFQQWNPTKSNQQSDAAYTADSLRSGGAATNAIFASPLANKLFYQVTTFVAALAQSMATKGYVLSEAFGVTPLAGVLANLITQADLPGLNINQTLYRNNALPAHTGTVTKDTVFSVAIGAGQILSNAIIQITLRFSATIAAGSISIYAMLGGVGPAINISATRDYEIEFKFVMPGVTNNENLLVKIIENGGVDPVLLNEGAQGVDLTSGATLALAIQNTNAGSSVTLNSVLVQLL